MFLFSFLFYCFNTAEDERKINQNQSFTLVVDDVFKNLEVLSCHVRVYSYFVLNSMHWHF